MGDKMSYTEWYEQRKEKMVTIVIQIIIIKNTE